jgi:hypothetical protein
MAKDYSRVPCQVVLDLSPNAFSTENRYPYQLATVISHLRNHEKDQSHYMTFLRIFGQWIQFNDTQVEAFEESAPLQKISRNRGILQTATILPYVACN